MVHVGVGEQDHVDLRQFGDGERGLHEAFDAERDRAEADAGALAEDRVGEDGEAIDLKQHGRVAEPGGVETRYRARRGIGAVRRGPDVALKILCKPLVESRCRPVHPAPRSRMAIPCISSDAGWAVRLRPVY